MKPIPFSIRHFSRRELHHVDIVVVFFHCRSDSKQGSLYKSISAEVFNSETQNESIELVFCVEQFVVVEFVCIEVPKFSKKFSKLDPYQELISSKSALLYEIF